MYFDQMKTIFENWKISAEILEIQKFDFDKNFMFPAKNADVFEIQELLDFDENSQFLLFSSKNCILWKKWF